MSKTLRVLFLSLFVVVFATSSLFAAEYTLSLYTDNEHGDGYDITANDVVVEGSTEADDALEYTYYHVGYILPGEKAAMLTSGDDDPVPLVNGSTVMYKISWDLKPEDENDSWLKWSVEESNDNYILYMNGVLPDYISEASADHKFTLNASTVSQITGFNDEASCDISITVTVVQDTDHIIVSSDGAYKNYFNNRVKPEQGVTLGTVNSNYEVTVTVPKNDNGNYLNHINSDDMDSPGWLVYDIVDSDDGGVTSIVLKYSNDVEAEYGDVNVVRIPFTDEDTANFPNGEEPPLLVWTVTYGSSSPSSSGLTLTSSDATIEAKAGLPSSIDIAYTGEAPVSYDASGIVSLDVLGLVIESTDNGGSGDIIITVTPTEAGVFSGNIVFTASGDATATFSLAVSVDHTFAVTPSSLTIKAVMNHVASEKFEYKDIAPASWDISPDIPSAISYEFTPNSSDKSITVKVTPAESDDDYSYEGTVTFWDDSRAYSQDVALTINVVSKDDAGSTMTVTASPSSLTLTAGGSAGTVTLTANGASASGDVSWTYTVSPQIAGLNVVFSPDKGTSTTATVTASNAVSSNDYTVTVTAKEGDNTGTAAISVKVSAASGSPEDPGNNNQNGSGVVEQIPTTNAQAIANGAASALGLTSVDMYNGVYTSLATTSSVLSSLSNVYSEDFTAATAIALPIAMNPDKTGLYVFSISKYLTGVQAGDALTPYVAQIAFTPAAVRAVADDDAKTDSVLVDNEGKELKVMPADGNVNLAASLEGGKHYAAVIKHVTPTTPTGDGTGPGESSGGCSAGLGALALMFAVPLFLRKRG